MREFDKAANIGSVKLRNRVIMGSMHTGLEEAKDLGALAEFYRERAAGGVGLIVTGGISPNKAGVVFAGGSEMSSHEHVQKHKIVTKTVHDAGGKIFMQILHAGRYALTPDLVAPSEIKSPITPLTPKALTSEEIEQTIEDFALCAELSLEAGYDVVEVMGSEGYLINQFLVTHTNKREDDWGGSYANRMRFPIEIIRRIRARVGSKFGIIFRISLLDLVENGSTKEEVKALAEALEHSGVDALNSGFGWHEARVPTIAANVPPTPFLDLTEELKSWVGIPVIAANRFFEPSQIDNAIKSGKADFVAMARPFLADAEFMKKLGEPEEIVPCIACNQACLDRIFQMKHASCLVNPRACRETSMKIEPASSPNKIAVVGAGPAGLSASILLSERGHHVSLFEASGEIGGQLKLAAKIPGKEDFKRLLDHYQTMIERRQIALRFEEAQADQLAAFDVVVIATGVRPRVADIDGIENGLKYDDLINSGSEAKTVAILGSGPIGFDVASLLLDTRTETVEDWRKEWGVSGTDQSPGGLGQRDTPAAARNVTMFQRSTKRFGRALGKTTGWIHRMRLERAGVEMIGGVDYQNVNDEGVVYSKDGEMQRVNAELVAICTGQESVNALYDECLSKGIDVHIIGGAKDAHKIDAERAIFEAYDLALKL